MNTSALFLGDKNTRHLLKKDWCHNEALLGLELMAAIKAIKLKERTRYQSHSSRFSLIKEKERRKNVSIHLTVHFSRTHY